MERFFLLFTYLLFIERYCSKYYTGQNKMSALNYFLIKKCKISALELTVFKKKLLF